MSYEGRFDVVIEGAGATRGARVVAAPDGLYVNDHEVPYATLLGVALRSSILLVIGTQIALALRGDREGLATLAAELRRHADLSHLAAPDREALEDERVVFSTPVALSGVVDSERLKGLSLAIVTDSALHMLERGGRRTRLTWEDLERVDVKEARFGRAIELMNPEADLELLYLTDAQIQTVRGLAGRHGAGSGAPGPGVRPKPKSRPAPPEPRPPAKGKTRKQKPPEHEPPEQEPPEHEPPTAAEEPPEHEAAGPTAEEEVPELEGRVTDRSDEPIETVEGLQSSEFGPLIDAIEPRRAPPSRRPPTGRDRSVDREPRSGPGSEPEGGPSPLGGPASTLPGMADPLRQFRIPEFERSLGSVGTGSDRPLAAAIDRLQMSPVLPVGFLEEHLRELRTVYNGALVARKREAAAASDLTLAARALDGNELWSDLNDRIGVIADAMLRAFERQARRLAANRRIPWRRARRKHVPRGKELKGLRQRLSRGITPLENALADVTRAGQDIRAAVDRGQGDLQDAYRRWVERLRDMDEAYAAGWSGLGREIVGAWEESLLPRLNALASQRRRWLPWPLRAALYFALFIGALMIAYLLFVGQAGPS